MKSYDKASWHIDGGEKEKDVISRFKKIFQFLMKNGMLSEEGIETLEYCMESSVSLNTTMVTIEGQSFLDMYYDKVLKQSPKRINANLQSAYKKFKREMEKQ